MGLARLLHLCLLVVYALQVFSVIGLSQTKEYIRLNGRVVAIESPGVDNAAQEAAQTGDIPSLVNISTAFTATVRVRNTGTTTWTSTDYTLQPQGATAADFGIGAAVSLPAGTTSVAPNQVVVFQVSGTARSTTCASCSFQFKMAKTGAAFGSVAGGTINIVGSVAVSISPSSSVTLNRGETASFTATVSNSSSNTLNWTNPSQGTFQAASTQSGGANTFTAPASIGADASVSGNVCSAGTPSACASVPIQLKKIGLSLVSGGQAINFGSGTRTFTASLSGLSPTASRGIVFTISSSNSYTGSFSSSSSVLSTTQTASGAPSATGSATVTYYPPACASTCASPTITITAQSVHDGSQIATLQFTVSQAQQTITGAQFLSPSSTDTVLQFTVADPIDQSRISNAEFVLSPSSTANQYPANQSCRFRVYRAAGAYHLQLDDAYGSGNWGADYTLGTGGLISNGACKIDLTQSSGSPASPTTSWAISLKLSNVSMSGARYLRGATTATGGSAGVPSGYLGATWNVPAPPTFTITNSQGTTPPSLYQGNSVTLNMQVANLCGGCVAKFKLAQANDGSLTHTNPAPAPYQAQAAYSAGNAGEDRDIYVRAIIYNNLTAWQNDDASQIYWESASPYAIHVVSSVSQLPALNFYNPVSGSSNNPNPVNSTVTANGVATTFITYGIDNRQWPATTCFYGGSCLPIKYLYFNINKTFTESSLAQDRANGCRLRMEIYSGSSPVSYYFWLTNDAGQNETGFMWFPNYGGGSSLSNGQCTVDLNTYIGAYAQAAGASGYQAAIGLRFTFKTPFAGGQRHIFMMGERINGDWSGWEYRGKYTMQ